MTGPDDRTLPRADHDEYSATALGSQWVQRPDPDTTLVDSSATTTMLRFGPGVTHRATMALPPGRSAAPGRLRRHALPVLVLVAAVLFVLWRQHTAQPAAVRSVTVTAGQAAGCDRTVDLVGTVRTNGRAGTLTYRWIRNDGTASPVLRTALARGTHSVRLHLLWSFEGQGHYGAVATLRVLAPDARSAEVRFAYDCP